MQIPLVMAVVAWAVAWCLRIDAAGAASNWGASSAQEMAPPALQETSGILPLSGRSLGDCDVANLLVVSDIDGNLHGIDRQHGFIRWTLPIEEPLVQIRTADSNQTKESILWFVEPYQDGSLYYFTPKFGLNKIPTSIRELVMASPFSLRDDNKIYTGSRTTSLYEVNVHTGHTRPLLGDSEQCPIPRTHHPIELESGSAQDTFLIGKTTFELTIADKHNSEMVWNVTYSQWGPNNIDNDLILQNRKSADNSYFYPFYDKVLLAYNNREKWGCKLPGIAVSIFDIFHNANTGEYVMLPHPSPQIDDDNYARDKVFLTKTANNMEWIAMSYGNYPSLIKTAEYAPYTLDLLKMNQGYPFDRERLFNFNLSNSSNADVEAYVSGLHECHLLTAATNYQPQQRFGSRAQPVAAIGDGRDTTTTTDTPNIIGGGIKFSSEDDSMSGWGVPDARVTEEVTAAVDPIETSEPIRRIFGSSILKRVIEDVVVLLILFVLIMTFGKSSKLFRSVRRAIDDKSDYGYVVEYEEHTPLMDGVAQFDQEAQNDIAVLTNETSEKGFLSEEKITKKESVKIDPKVTAVSENNTIEVIELEAADEADAPKKKRKRGSRGGKRGGRRINKNNGGDDEEAFLEIEETTTAMQATKSLPIENNLVISDKILGYGSHGTVVYQGMFENRPVAVKRMLLDFYDVASHEVRLLQESDDHENVVRYYCSQTSSSEKFLYIALELCMCSLEDIVEKPNKRRAVLSNVNLTLFELASGLHHLHQLKIVHRDIKPQNILVSDRKKALPDEPPVRLLISDFGLCKKLDADQSSFRATTQHAASGTSGWRAPELLLNHDLSEISPDTISSVNSSTALESLEHADSVPAKGKRLTKAIDIFALGCVYYYILTGGSHPYGDRYMREANIVNGRYDVSRLAITCPRDRFEAEDLICSMIHHDFRHRPTTTAILAHPLFWSCDRRLQFLLAVSDRFDLERRDPPSELLQQLESHASAVIGTGWHAKFDSAFLDHLGKHRKYLNERLSDLLRAIRNKYHHFADMPVQLQRQMTKPDKFYNYFLEKFPNLLMEVYGAVASAKLESGARLRDEDVFVEYFSPL
ncbi:hypothetical protein DIURU_002329 [Diutina rugosa]|uniref:non-specific serine/threonine protein kinase n=1 Tax=Diutina rugosa TaxID=5481 RepID=A0A642UQ15_DIURU|nr:uncharacterized protein DIURU_002329 [Diutina rugosa]KAA8903443.1 hypothetical protein DIURU_002329 [Diutina rugosa]